MQWFHTVFGKNFYVEIQNNGLNIQKEFAEGAITIANKLGLPLVATSDAHYLTQADANAHDVLLCINTGAKRTDETRTCATANPAPISSSISSTWVRRKRCNASSPARRTGDTARRLPTVAPSNWTSRAPLPRLHAAGRQETRRLPASCVTRGCERYGEAPSQIAKDRLELELDVICRMGFASYFLIVGDFVRFAVENGIPARHAAPRASPWSAMSSSSATSIRWNTTSCSSDSSTPTAPSARHPHPLLSGPPEEVIAYVRRKYGEGSVAQIATFGTMAARAIKDVGRVLDFPLERSPSRPT